MSHVIYMVKKNIYGLHPKHKWNCFSIFGRHLKSMNIPPRKKKRKILHSREISAIYPTKPKNIPNFFC